MLKKITWLLLIISLSVCFFSFRNKFYSFQPPSNYSGAPDGFGLCSDCHGNLNSGGGGVTINGLPASFQPGQTYGFSVTINHPVARGRWGFEINARNANGNTVGTFTSMNANAAINGGPAELSHLNAVFSSGTSYTYNNLFWTAPSSITPGDNNVTFYTAGNAANGDGSSAGDFIYLTTSQITLPITLKTLDYKVIDDYKVKINWVTASEANSKEFIIEKSNDNNNYQEAGRVMAAGSSSSDKSYSYTDNNPSYFNRLIYYRIKLVDLDGKFKYSKIFQLTLKGKSTYIYSLSPNPVSDYLNVGILSDKVKQANVRILSSAGNVVLSRPIQLQPGKMIYKIQTTSLPRGTYFLTLESNEYVQNIAFVAL